MKVYSVVNGLALFGVFLEFFGYRVYGTGGLGGEEFFRSLGDSQFLMVVGFHRSPDIMALHAANVVMFSTILLLGERNLFKNPWMLFIAVGLIALFLGGRRKMLLMPLLFWLTNVLLDFHPITAIDESTSCFTGSDQPRNHQRSFIDGS